MEALYKVGQVCGETYLHPDIEQLIEAYIVKGLVVMNKSNKGSFFGLNQFLYHDLKCTDQIYSSLIIFWKPACSSGSSSEMFFCSLLSIIFNRILLAWLSKAIVQ